MKKTKLILLAMTCVAMLSLSSCDSKKTLTKEELPAAAQAYLQQNFPTANVLLVRQESEAFEGKEFEVKLDNGVELKFDADGQLIDLDQDTPIMTGGNPATAAPVAPAAATPVDSAAAPVDPSATPADSGNVAAPAV